MSCVSRSEDVHALNLFSVNESTFVVFNVELWQIKSVLVTSCSDSFSPKNKRTLNPVSWLYIPIFVIHTWTLLHIQYIDFWIMAVGIFFFILQQLSDQRNSWHCGLTWNSGKYASDKIPACRYVPVLVWNGYLVPHSSGKIDFYQPYWRPLTPYWLLGSNPSGCKNESCC